MSSLHHQHHGPEPLQRGGARDVKRNCAERGFAALLAFALLVWLSLRSAEEPSLSKHDVNGVRYLTDELGGSGPHTTDNTPPQPESSVNPSRSTVAGTGWLDLGPILFGQVADASSGAAIDARIEWTGGSGLWTGPSGRFRLLTPSLSPVWLRVRAAGYFGAVFQGTPGTGQLLRLALTSESRVRVRVWRDGLPAIGAEVHMVAENTPSGLVGREPNGPFFTNTSGIVECPLERTSMLFSTLAGDASRPVFTDSASDEIELSIDTGRGRGRLGVRNRHGTPLPGFAIQLGPAREDGPTMQCSALADGILPVELPAGPYRASNAPGRAGRLLLSPAAVEIARDQTTWIVADEHAGWQVRLVEALDGSAVPNQAMWTQLVLHKAGRERALMKHSVLSDDDGDVCWWVGESPASADWAPMLVLRSPMFVTSRIPNPFVNVPMPVVALVRRSVRTLIADSGTNPPSSIEIHQGDPSPIRLQLVDRSRYESFDWSGEDITIQSLGATLARVAATELDAADTIAFRVPQRSTITLTPPDDVQVGDVICLSDLGDRVEPTHMDSGLRFDVPLGTGYHLIPRAWSEYFEPVNPSALAVARAADATQAAPWNDAFAAVLDLTSTIEWLGPSERPSLWVQPVWAPPGVRPTWEPDGDEWRVVLRPDGSYHFSHLPSRPQQIICGTGLGRTRRIYGDVSTTRTLELATLEFESSTPAGELRVSYSPDLGKPSLPGITTARTVSISNGLGALNDVPTSVRSITCAWRDRHFTVAVGLTAGAVTRVGLDD